MLILHLTKSEKNKQNSIFPTSYPKKSSHDGLKILHNINLG